MTSLKVVLRQHFSEKICEVIIQNFERVVVAKTDILIDMHQRVQSFYFIESGLFKSYYIDEHGLEVTFDFYGDAEVLTILESLIRGDGSEFCVQALEQSVVHKISKENLEMLIREYPELDALRFMALAKHTSKSINRTKIHQLPTAKQRLAKFIACYPGVLERCKNKDVASFLRVTKESFSRLNKQ